MRDDARQPSHSPAPLGRRQHRRAALRGLAAAVVVLGALLLIQFLTYDRIGVEKMLTEMAQPYGLLWLALTLAAAANLSLWLSGSIRLPRLAAVSGLWVAATLAGNSWIAEMALRQTQAPLHADPVTEASFDAVIMLGGGIGQDPLGGPQLEKDGDRIRPVLRLWHAGRVERILVTGTSSHPDQPYQGDLAKRLLIEFGVPEDAIETVPGRNTSEEMVALGELFDAWEASGSGSPRRIGLVTSAFHMPRALRLARQHGLERLVPLPAAHRGGGPPIGWARSVIPTASALNDLSLCWKEWIAAAVGR